MKKAVVLLSGGIDSAVTLAIAQNESYECYILIFNCRQPIEELNAAMGIAKHFTVAQFHVKDVYLPGRVEEKTFNLPGRNLIFLSFAAAWAAEIRAERIFIGAHIQDYSDYPDCRLKFFRSFEATRQLAFDDAQPWCVRVPLINLTKEQIIQKGIELKVPFEKTFSCYCPVEGGISCGKCHSCVERLEGFKAAGMKDPIEYVKE